MTTELHLLVLGHDELDQAKLAAQLRAELKQIAAVRQVAATPPPDAKAAGAFEWAGLIVSLTGTLPVLVQAVRSWLDRRRSPEAAVTLRLGEDEITLHCASDAEERELLAAFLDRHADD